MLLTASGTVKCWGQEDLVDSLGNGASDRSFNSPVDVVMQAKPIHLLLMEFPPLDSGKQIHTCALNGLIAR